MRYLGGKSKLAKEIATLVAPRGIWWEPFCGGLSMSVALAKYGPGVVSDGNKALIALYQAVAGGWDPPANLTEAEYQAARSLDDSNPLKAFVGFGCSFGGKWFGGMARGGGRNYTEESRRAVVRDLAALRGCDIRCLSFFDVDPGDHPAPETIYADPPYEGTEPYGSMAPFDHTRFWQLCQAWAKRGARVFVSEYNCPVAHTVLWEKPHPLNVAGGAVRKAARLERLFLIHK